MYAASVFPVPLGCGRASLLSFRRTRSLRRVASSGHQGCLSRGGADRCRVRRFRPDRPEGPLPMRTGPVCYVLASSAVRANVDAAQTCQAGDS